MHTGGESGFARRACILGLEMSLWGKLERAEEKIKFAKKYPPPASPPPPPHPSIYNVFPPPPLKRVNKGKNLPPPFPRKTCGFAVLSFLFQRKSLSRTAAAISRSKSREILNSRRYLLSENLRSSPVEVYVEFKT